jgi:quercetin dioxygenase-like cupin family protein
VSVKRIEEVPAELVPDAFGVSKQVLISAGEAPNFAMRCFTIQPGGSMPLHTNLVEHEQYVLGGNAKVVIGEESCLVGPGSVVFIPAGAAHAYVNTGSEPFRFLCLIPNREDKTSFVSS